MSYSDLVNIESLDNKSDAIEFFPRSWAHAASIVKFIWLITYLCLLSSYISGFSVLVEPYKSSKCWVKYSSAMAKEYLATLAEWSLVYGSLFSKILTNCIINLKSFSLLLLLWDFKDNTNLDLETIEFDNNEKSVDLCDSISRSLNCSNCFIFVIPSNLQNGFIVSVFCSNCINLSDGSESIINSSRVGNIRFKVSSCNEFIFINSIVISKLDNCSLSFFSKSESEE